MKINNIKITVYNLERKLLSYDQEHNKGRAYLFKISIGLDITEAEEIKFRMQHFYYKHISKVYSKGEITFYANSYSILKKIRKDKIIRMITNFSFNYISDRYDSNTLVKNSIESIFIFDKEGDIKYIIEKFKVNTESFNLRLHSIFKYLQSLISVENNKIKEL